MDNQDNIIGAYIRHLRDLGDLTLEQLGGLVGLSKQRLSTIEKGLVGRHKNLTGIAEHFGKSIDGLIADAIKWNHSQREKDSGARFVEAMEQAENGQVINLLQQINNNLVAISKTLDEIKNGGTR